jgi:hypothetical protein
MIGSADGLHRRQTGHDNHDRKAAAGCNPWEAQ